MSPINIGHLGSVAGLLAAVTVLAALVPSLRAARMDPRAVLRRE